MFRRLYKIKIIRNYGNDSGKMTNKKGCKICNNSRGGAGASEASAYLTMESLHNFIYSCNLPLFYTDNLCIYVSFSLFRIFTTVVYA